jgi:hypothetical protein
MKGSVSGLATGLVPPLSIMHISHDNLPASARDVPSTRKSRNGGTPHFSYLSNGSTPWLTLKVTSSATSPDKMPKFFEKNPISGDVIVVAEPGDSISSVSVHVTGRVVTGSAPTDCITFLDIAVPLWAKPSSRSGSPFAGQSENMPPKLHGTFKFPFSIPIPSSIAFDYQKFALPHSFTEKHTRVSVCYELTVRVSRGKLRANNQLIMPFGFVPFSKPPPVSHQRRMAYEDSVEIPGPLDDQAGWYGVDGCDLSIALPLSYTRSSVIPLVLPPFLRSSTEIHLRRRVQYLLSNGMRQTQDQIVGKSTWWDGQVDLRGEIKLDKTLLPSTSLGRWLDVSYAVVCFSETGAILAEVPVTITTSFASGPKPLAYAPPPYCSTTTGPVRTTKRRSENYEGPYTHFNMV